jgi:hypothetical protein
MAVNAREFAFEDISFKLGGVGKILQIKNIQYKWNRAAEQFYGASGVPVAWSLKGYEAEASIEVLKSVFAAICDFAALTGVALADLPPFPVTVSYGMPGQPLVIDTLPSVRIAGAEQNHGQGDTNLTVSIPLDVLEPIEYGATKSA